MDIALSYVDGLTHVRHRYMPNVCGSNYFEEAAFIDAALVPSGAPVVEQ